MNTMYENILELCRRDGINVTQMCRQLKIPRSTLSELGAGRTKQLTLKHAGPIAEFFGARSGGRPRASGRTHCGL